MQEKPEKILQTNEKTRPKNSTEEKNRQFGKNWQKQRIRMKMETKNGKKGGKGTRKKEKKNKNKTKITG